MGRIVGEWGSNVVQWGGNFAKWGSNFGEPGGNFAEPGGWSSTGVTIPPTGRLRAAGMDEAADSAAIVCAAEPFATAERR